MNADIDKFKYSAYGIGFDKKEFFSYRSGGTSRNVIIFGVIMSSSAKIDNKKKKINSWPCTTIRTYTSCRKNVFN